VPVRAGGGARLDLLAGVAGFGDVGAGAFVDAGDPLQLGGAVPLDDYDYGGNTYR